MHALSYDYVASGDDAALVVPPAPPAYTVHTLDYFRSFVSDPYLFGQIAANHALSGLFCSVLLYLFYSVYIYLFAY